MSHIIKNLNQLRLDKKLCDVTLKIGEQKFHCHRIILASVSEYFKTMFTSDFIECKLDEIPLVDFNQINFQIFLDWVYTENTTAVTPNNVMDVLKMAHRLFSEGLVEFLENYMKENLSISNLVEYYTFSVDYQFPKITKFCIKYLESNYWHILENKTYLELPFEVFTNCLAMDENSKLEIITNWIEYDKNKRSNCYGDLVKCIKLKERQICIIGLNMDAHCKLLHLDFFSYDSCNGLVEYREDGSNAFTNSLDDVRYYFMRHNMFIVGLNGHIFLSYVNDFNCKFFKHFNPYSQTRFEWKNFAVPPEINDESIEGLVSLNRMNKIFASISSRLSSILLIYNADTDKWEPSTLEIFNDTICQRSLVADDNELLYLYGGVTHELLPTYELLPMRVQTIISLYDHRVPSIQDIGMLTVPTIHSAACVCNNSIYVTGGQVSGNTDNWISTNIVQRYDITAGKTEVVQPMIHRKDQHSVVSYDDKIWTVGFLGEPVEFYDKTINQWQETDWDINTGDAKFMCLC